MIEEKRTKIFFDFEFTGLHQNTTPISLGMVSECGKTFYMEFDDYDMDAYKDHFLKKNVLYKMWIQNPEIDTNSLCDHYSVVTMNTASVEMMIFLNKFESIEMWGDVCSCGWVLFCRLFYCASCMPKNVFHIPFDIATLIRTKGINPDTNRLEYAEEDTVKVTGLHQHNSLFKALIIKKCYNKLTKNGRR